MSDKVNCFLIGAQKSGSTALAEYLTQHSDISISKPKAPNFFSDKFHKTFKVKSHREYRTLFDFSKKIRCDASDCYHADLEALKKISNYNKDSKIIMILRDPEKMLLSLHQHLIWNGYENVDDINLCFNLISDRRRGNSIPTKCPDKNYLMYDDLCAIGNQILALNEIFPQKNVKYISSKKLRNNKMEVLNELCDWLEVDRFKNVHTVASNEAVELRSSILRDISNNISPVVKTRIKIILSKLGFSSDGLMRKINGKKSTVKKNVNISTEIRDFCNKQRELVFNNTNLDDL